ncbi:hypothetical protein SEVIR_1G017800v4 [Setaria viridis]|uniref:F-box protein AT5G49610-like beta-propeller domain-containing protein n=1 Tax=Setaria viridis TaxID=4556 RepID=A0A4U6W836_SETVI|nr:uncharacterized protein LOC117834602 [Setaria viridis]TKW36989.1 hypothetical protein SEVIR_1G017800v2 [Setaria viridis]
MPTKAMMRFRPFEDDETSTAKVLTNDGLVGEILLRLDCPACLVRAAIINKRWLHNASDQAIIRSFRAKQSPRLLGIYVCSDDFSQPEFVPMPDASCPELAVALRHGNFNFPDMDSLLLNVWDCRNDGVLYEFGESIHAALAPAVRTPLRHPGEDTVVFPPQPSNTWPAECPHAMLLPDDDGDDSSCYRVDIGNKNQKVYARVLVLRAGSWSIHCSALADLARSPEKILTVTLLMRGKIYMLTRAGYILALDLATARFSIVDLPEGVEFEYHGNLTSCRGDDSALYLFHVKGDKLTVWLKRMNEHGDDGSRNGDWVLRDTISLLETCGHLVEQDCEPADGQEDGVSVVGVGDNAEFVFLEFVGTGVIVYMHLKSRNVKKVYQRNPDNDFVIRVLPFVMVWPPIFPEHGADMKVTDCIKSQE